MNERDKDFFIKYLLEESNAPWDELSFLLDNLTKEGKELVKGAIKQLKE